MNTIRLAFKKTLVRIRYFFLSRRNKKKLTKFIDDLVADNIDDNPEYDSFRKWKLSQGND